MCVFLYSMLGLIIASVLIVINIDNIQSGIESIQAWIRGQILMKTCYYTTRPKYEHAASNELAHKTIIKAINNIINKNPYEKYDNTRYCRFRYVDGCRVQEYYLVPVGLDETPWFGLSLHEYLDIHRLKVMNRRNPNYNPGFIHIYKSIYDGLIPSVKYVGTLSRGNDNYYGSAKNDKDGKIMYRLITWLADNYNINTYFKKKRFIFW